MDNFSATPPRKNKTRTGWIPPSLPIPHPCLWLYVQCLSVQQLLRVIIEEILLQRDMSFLMYTDLPTSHANIAYRQQIPPQRQCMAREHPFEGNYGASQTLWNEQSEMWNDARSLSLSPWTLAGARGLKPIGSSAWPLTQTLVTTGCK